MKALLPLALVIAGCGASDPMSQALCDDSRYRTIYISGRATCMDSRTMTAVDPLHCACNEGGAFSARLPDSGQPVPNGVTEASGQTSPASGLPGESPPQSL